MSSYICYTIGIRVKQKPKVKSKFHNVGLRIKNTINSKKIL